MRDTPFPTDGSCQPTTIGDICDRFGGSIQTGPFGSQLHADEYVRSGVPVVMPQDMVDGRIVEARIARITPERARTLERHRLLPGDIVYSRRGDVTRFATVEEAQRGWICGTGSIRIRLNSPELHLPYVRHQLRYKGVTSWLLHEAKGVTMPNLNTEIIRGIPFFYPPLEEQRRIAAILDAAEALRQKRRQALRLLDQLTQAIFVEMFGDPATNPKHLKYDALGEYLVRVTNGMSRRRSQGDEGNAIVLRLKEIRAGHISLDAPNRITLSDAEKERYRVSPGDLLFIRVNGNPDYVGRNAVFAGHSEEVYFNDHIMRVRLDLKSVNAEFLSFVLNSNYGRSQITMHRKTSAGQHTINQDGLSKIRIPLPPVDLQNLFSERLSTTRNNRAASEASLIALDALFASLQYRAFRGEL